MKHLGIGMISGRSEGLFVLVAVFLVVSGVEVGATNYQSGSLAYASSSANAYAGASASSSAISSANSFAGSLAGLNPVDFQVEGHKGIRSYDSTAYAGYNGAANEGGPFGHFGGVVGPGNNRQPDTADSRRSNCAKCKWEDDDYWEKEEPEEPEEEERDWEECDDHDDGQYHHEKSHRSNKGPEKIGGAPPKISPAGPQPSSHPGSINNNPTTYVAPSYPSVKGGPAPDFKPTANHPPLPEHRATQSTGSYPGSANNNPTSYAPPRYPSVKGSATPDFKPPANHPPLPGGRSTQSTPVAPWNKGGVTSSTPGYTGSAGYSRPKTPTSWNPLGLQPVSANSGAATTRAPARTTTDERRTTPPHLGSATTSEYSSPWNRASTLASAPTFANTPSQHGGSTWTTRGTPTATVFSTTPRPYWNNPTANSPCSDGRQDSSCGGGPRTHGQPTKGAANNPNVASGYPDPTGYKPSVDGRLPMCSNGQAIGGCIPGNPLPSPGAGGHWPKPTYGSPALSPSPPGTYPQYPGSSVSPVKGGAPSGKPNGFPGASSPTYLTPINNSPSAFYPTTNNQPSPTGYSPKAAPNDKGYPRGEATSPPSGNGYHPNLPAHPNLNSHQQPIAGGPTYYPSTSSKPYNPQEDNRKGQGPFGPTSNNKPEYAPPIRPSGSELAGAGAVATAGAAPIYPAGGNCGGRSPCGGNTATSGSYPGDSGFPNKMNGCNGQNGPCPGGCGESGHSGCVGNGRSNKIHKVSASPDNSGLPISLAGNYGGVGGIDVNVPITNSQVPGSGSPSTGGCSHLGCPDLGPSPTTSACSPSGNCPPAGNHPPNQGPSAPPSGPPAQGAYNWNVANPFLNGKLPAPGLGGFHPDVSYSAAGSTATESAPAGIGKGNPFLEGGVHGPNSWGSSKPGYDSDKTMISPPKPAPHKPIGQGNPFFQKASGNGPGDIGIGPTTIHASPAGEVNVGTPTEHPAFGNQVPPDGNSFSGSDNPKNSAAIAGSASFGTGSFPPAKGGHPPKDQWPASGNFGIGSQVGLGFGGPNLNPAGFGSSNSFAGAFSSAGASSISSADRNAAAGSASFAGSGAAALAQPAFGQINPAQDWSSQNGNQSPTTKTASNTNPWASSAASAYASASSWAGAGAGHY